MTIIGFVITYTFVGVGIHSAIRCIKFREYAWATFNFLAAAFLATLPWW